MLFSQSSLENGLSESINACFLKIHGKFSVMGMIEAMILTMIEAKTLTMLVHIVAKLTVTVAGPSHDTKNCFSRF